MKEELKKLIEAYEYDDDDLYETEDDGFDADPYGDEVGPEIDRSFDDIEDESGYDDFDADEPSYDDEDSGYESYNSLDDFLSSLKGESDEADAYSDLDRDDFGEFGESIKALEEKEARLEESLKKVRAEKAKLLKK